MANEKISDMTALVSSNLTGAEILPLIQSGSTINYNTAISELLALASPGTNSFLMAGLDFYVNSVNGSDTYAGTTVARPYRTIAKLLTQSLTGKKIGLFTNSIWEETLDLTTPAYTGAIFYALGNGAAPLLDCSTAINAGAWSATSSSNVYQTLVTVETASGKTFNQMWENGKHLISGTSSAYISGVAGSYYASDNNGGTAPIFTMYLHTSDNSSPITNGKEYRYAKRRYGIYDATGASSFFGVWTRRNLHNDGSFIGSGLIQGCMMTEGGLHNALMHEGATIQGCKLLESYCTSSGYLLVFNDDAPTGKDIFVDGCTFQKTQSVTNGVPCGGFYVHRNVSGSYGSVNVSRSYFSGFGTTTGDAVFAIGWSSDTKMGNVISNRIDNCTYGVVPGSTLLAAGNSISVLDRGIDLNSGGVIGTLIDNHIYASATSAIHVYCAGAPRVIADYNSFSFAPGAHNFVSFYGDSTPLLWARNNKFYNAGYNFVGFAKANLIDLRNNEYIGDDTGNHWQFDGLDYTLLTYRTATGMDADHQEGLAVINGTANALLPHTPRSYMVTSTTVNAMTLAAPTATTDDGVILTILSNSTYAHSITATGLLQTGSSSVNKATFAVFPGAAITLRAYQGKWNAVSQVGITFS